MRTVLFLLSGMALLTAPAVAQQPVALSLASPEGAWQATHLVTIHLGGSGGEGLEVESEVVMTLSVEGDSVRGTFTSQLELPAKLLGGPDGEMQQITTVYDLAGTLDATHLRLSATSPSARPVTFEGRLLDGDRLDLWNADREDAEIIHFLRPGAKPDDK